MDVLDKILKEHSWKFSKGYPDINLKEDRDLLESIVNNYLTEAEEEIELEDDKDVLGIKGGEGKDPSGGSKIYNDTIRFALYGKDWEGQAIPRPKKKYPFQNGTFSFSVDPLDKEVFSKLYPVSPPKVGKEIGSEGSKGVGNGEIALYWLYQFSESAKVEEGRVGDQPDLIFDGKGVEVKAWDTHNGMKGLGRFGADKENLQLLSIIFGFNALATVLGQDNTSKTVNPTNFSGPQLEDAMEKVKVFKELIDQNEDLSNTYPVFKNIKDNTYKLYSDLGLSDSEDTEDMAAKMAVQLLEPKLERKPGDGNHLANVKSDGNIKFFKIEFKKLKDSNDLLTDFAVKQSAIELNFDKIWG